MRRMSILTVDADGAHTIAGLLMTRDHDVFDICPDRSVPNTDRDYVRPVSDADLRVMARADLAKLAAPRVASSPQEQILALRALNEIGRRQEGDDPFANAKPPDCGMDIRVLSVKELVRVQAPRVNPTEREQQLAKRATGELFRRVHGG